MNRAESISYPAAGALAEVFAEAWRRIAAAIQAYAEARRRAAAVRELERLSDRTLRDIGLHRGQIRSVVYGERS